MCCRGMAEELRELFMYGCGPGNIRRAAVHLSLLFHLSRSYSFVWNFVKIQTVNLQLFLADEL